MMVNIRTNCPHVEESNLMDIKNFKEIDFKNLKCQDCNETKELWICLKCGKAYCSRYINKHFCNHYDSDNSHCISLGIMDLSIWCNKCDDINNPGEIGCYIGSPITDEYKNIYYKYKFPNEQNGEIEIPIKEKNEEISENLCEHIETEFIYDNLNGGELDNDLILKERNNKHINKDSFFGLCLSCLEIIKDKGVLIDHFNDSTHNLYIDLIYFNLRCESCSKNYDFKSVNGLIQYKTILTILKEKMWNFPKNFDFLTDSEIYELKYKSLIEKLKKHEFKKIIFMVGAGISTTAGIPDFRSKSGLFKQLQDKYNLQSPEQFFEINTFLEKPEYFYEFTKLFDLSAVQPTITHKFMNFLVKRNIVKYVFTQNIDGLEKKAKIDDDKLVFAHGNFYEGHCGRCKEKVDIEKINEGVKNLKIYHCEKCGGPCKPNIVFYGEGLPVRFYKTLDDCKNDTDLIIIMGTSLIVQPFASIPYFISSKTYKLVLNYEKVGNFLYEKLTSDSLFIQGVTDKTIIKLLKDVDLLEDFRKFIKSTYSENLDELINIKIELMKVEDKKEEKKQDESEETKLSDDLDKKLNIKDD